MAPGKSGSGNGFQPMGLSDPVFRGVVRMGFRVSQTLIRLLHYLDQAKSSYTIPHCRIQLPFKERDCR